MSNDFIKMCSNCNNYKSNYCKLTGFSKTLYDVCENWEKAILQNLKTNDPVNHPLHYTDTKIEVIDYIEDKGLNFNLGNVVKYVSRAGKKDKNKTIEDLKKGAWYLDREIKRLKGELNE